MLLNFLGVIAAGTVFLSVWLGHVSVRRIEFISPILWLPCSIYAALGISLHFFALRVENLLLSIPLGILGTTLLWDALEIVRQQRRVSRGHAPANPNNPRHVKILAAYPSATPADLLELNIRAGEQ